MGRAVCGMSHRRPSIPSYCCLVSGAHPAAAGSLATLDPPALDAQLNVVLQQLFLIMGVWPLIYTSLLIPSGKSGNGVPAWPFVTASYALGEWGGQGRHGVHSRAGSDEVGDACLAAAGMRQSCLPSLAHGETDLA